MSAYLKRHRETLLVILLGLVIFGALNWMMVSVNPERYTNPHYGPWSAFKNLVVSGFDFFAYYVITIWEPRYELFRHPLQSFFLYPLSELNKLLKDSFGINCAIYIVGVMWTFFSTISWILLYKIIRRVIGLSLLSSLLYTLLFFSFSHVMLATFVPDHMILTLCVLLSTVYIISTSKGNTQMWKILLLYFIGTGITTTNCVKVWMMDMVGTGFRRFQKVSEGFKCCFRRSLWFLVPTALLLGCYYWQDTHTQAEYSKELERKITLRQERDAVHSEQNKKQARRAALLIQQRRKKQLVNSKFFQWTDNTIDCIPLLYENIFGEGLLLHDTHVLEDANAGSNPRPVIVSYTHWWYYVINGIIVLLTICGIWVSRRKAIIWMVLLPFLFDMILHVGLAFAAADVYIMTAHWAFLIPISIALYHKCIEKNKLCSVALQVGVFLITFFLWFHNLTLTTIYLESF